MSNQNQDRKIPELNIGAVPNIVTTYRHATTTSGVTIAPGPQALRLIVQRPNFQTLLPRQQDTALGDQGRQQHFVAEQAVAPLHRFSGPAPLVSHILPQITSAVATRRLPALVPTSLSTSIQPLKQTAHTPALSPILTAKYNPIQLVNLPTTNPYLLLSLITINDIARDRDIMLDGNFDHRASMLMELDSILPEWRDEIRANNLMTFRRLNSNRMQYFGALYGVHMNKITLSNQDDISSFIEVMIYVRTRDETSIRLIVNSTHRSILESIVVYLGLNTNFISFISLPQLQEAVVTTNLNCINNAELQAYDVRRRMISTHKYSTTIKKLYNNNSWTDITLAPQHPMENIIINLDKYSNDQIINQFGIVIPLSYTGRINEYIMDNISSYTTVLSRKEVKIQPTSNLMFMGHAELHKYFAQLRDNEIFNNFNIYVSYNSRVELIDNIVSAVIKPLFFVPCPVIITRSANNTTCISEFEVTDTTIFPIAFGVISKYYTYEITELIGAFHRHGDDGFILFRCPENINMLFASDDVEKLRLLLQSFTPTTDIIELINRITTGIAEAKERTEHDNDFINIFRIFNAEDKRHIHKFLYDIFYIGMYMRRWKGPGHPYPMIEKETHTKSDPNDIVTKSLMDTKNHLELHDDQIIKFCMNLKVFEYQCGRIDTGNKPFSQEWKSVLDAKRCIRQASTMFIGTAYHYLFILFREYVPGININNIMTIS